MFSDDLSCERGCENEVVRFGTGEASEPVSGIERKRYWHYASEDISVDTGEVVPLSFVDGESDISRNGVLTLPEGRYTVFRSFECRSAGNLRRVRLTMNVGNSKRNAGSSVRTISGLFTQSFGEDIIDVSDGINVFFTVDGDQTANITNGFFDILITDT